MGLLRDNCSGVKSGPPGPIFACEIWTALAKSGPGKRAKDLKLHPVHFSLGGTAFFNDKLTGRVHFWSP